MFASVSQFTSHSSMRLKSFSSLVKYANYAVLILQSGLFCEIIQLQIEECRIQRKGEVVTP